MSLRPTTCNLQSNRGFVALFAVLISSIVLTIAMGLLQIALKELILSSTGRESQFGFYAADAGVECALYWDVHGNGGNGIFPKVANPPVTPILPLGTNCGVTDAGTAQDISIARTIGGVSFSAPTIQGDNARATTTFYLSVVPGQSCVTVEVGKSGDRTIIDAYGHNTCDSSKSRILIERGMRVTY